MVKKFQAEKIKNIVIGLVKKWNRLIEKEKSLKMKNCKKCLKSLDIESNFYKDKRNRGGYRNICKICEGSIKTPPKYIFCKKCNSNIEYSKYSTKTNQCKDCYLIQRKEKKTNSNRNRLKRDSDFKYQNVEFKFCITCKIGKDINLFPSRIDSKDGHRNQCSDCFTSNSSKTKKLYKQKNKESIREKDLIYRKERMIKDPLYRAKIDARNIIRKALSDRGYSKKSRTEEILGCSFEQFKTHIESLFVENMSWESRDEWHIDHIIPLSFAKNEKELLLINHYTNLRPIWAKENQLKSDKIEITNHLYDFIINHRSTLEE